VRPADQVAAYRAETLLSAEGREVLRGLDALAAEQPAGEVLEGERWEGPGLDPDYTPAGEFLEWL
jgi:hypothetical protein